MNNYIRVEGHTDNVPMNSTVYRSNWDLSAARAANVVRLLTSQTSIPPEMMIAVGYGEYRPIADNSTEEGRAKNRRIDIIVLSERYNDLEQ
jgi:chemotaxis protein MotB